MTSTLYVEVNYQNKLQSGWNLVAYLGTDFPTFPGFNAPLPQNTVAAASTTTSNPASLTGLTTGSAYWIVVTDGVFGYNWWYSAVPGTDGATSGTPFVMRLVLPRDQVTATAPFFLSSVQSILSDAIVPAVPSAAPPGGVILAGPVANNLTTTEQVAVISSGLLTVPYAYNGAYLTGQNGTSVSLVDGLIVAGGTDGNHIRALNVDSNGTLQVGPVSGGSPFEVMGIEANTGAISGNPVLVGGSDGAHLYQLLTDSSGQLKMLVENSVAVTNAALSAMTFSSGALEVDITASTSLAVTNAGLTALAATIQASGSAIPTDVVMAGASDGTDSRALLVDASGFLKVNVAAGGAGGGAVWGPDAAGAAPTEDPVSVAGWDGTDIRHLLTDNTGQLKVLVENTPAVTISSGTVTTVSTVTAVTGITNAVTVEGNVASGSAVSGANDPVLVAGSDGTDVRTVATDSSGRPVIVHPNNALLATTAESITSTVTTLSETASMNGMCVVVTISCVAAKTMAYPVAVRIRDTTNGITTNWQLSPIQIAGGAGCQLYFNLPVTNGDTVDIDIIAQGTVGAVSTNVAAVLSPLSIPTNLRPDGRSLPLSTETAFVGATSTAATLVPATAGWRALIGTGEVSVIATGGVGTLAGLYITIFGTSNPVILLTMDSAAGDSVNQSWPTGLLGDPDTAVVSGSAATGTQYVLATYDLVPQ